MNLASKRIFVGLSGGVDSAVTAALLKEQGALVTGVFIKGWYPPGMPCTWAEDRRDAMRVAARLQIPFHTLDASAEYKRGVIDYLLHEYKAGRTPNPDIMCNREVKFGAFYKFAIDHGADFIATGHYARIENGVLKRGIDGAKDQSYFLWAVPKEALAQTVFPLGSLKKEGTRSLAQRFKLPNADRKDSQGICFLGSISIDEFLKNEFGSESGEATLEDGSVIGTHDGAILRTLGERVSLTDAPPGPWYVVAKDIEANRLVVSHEPRVQSPASAIALSEVNLFADFSGTCAAQYRYHGPIIAGAFDSDHASFIPSEPLPEALASGQSLVLYAGDTVLGGGIIC